MFSIKGPSPLDGTRLQKKQKHENEFGAFSVYQVLKLFLINLIPFTNSYQKRPW